MAHRDADGKPCVRHPPLARERLLDLAVPATRLPAFHHDCASKLQSLMMALDELGELIDEHAGELRSALETAQVATGELNELFTHNRALVKAPVRSAAAIGALVEAVAGKVGVRVHGALPAHEVEVAVPAVRHALGLALGAVAGPSHTMRDVEIASRTDGDQLVLALQGPLHDAAPVEQEALEVAGYVLDREGGELRCSAAGVELRLPLARR